MSVILFPKVTQGYAPTVCFSNHQVSLMVIPHFSPSHSLAIGVEGNCLVRQLPRLKSAAFLFLLNPDIITGATVKVRSRFRLCRTAHVAGKYVDVFSMNFSYFPAQTDAKSGSPTHLLLSVGEPDELTPCSRLCRCPSHRFVALRVNTFCCRAHVLWSCVASLDPQL